MIGTRTTWLSAASLALLLVAPDATAASTDDAESSEERHVRVIEIDHDIDCTGDDCDALTYRDWAVDAEGIADLVRFAGRHRHGGTYLGVALTDLTPELRRHFGAPPNDGVMVSQVFDDSPAGHAGLLVGDIIAGVDGEAVASSRELGREIRRREGGDTVELEVWRDGALEPLTATLEESEPRTGHHLGGGDGHRIVIRCEEGDDCADLKVLDAFDCGDEAPCSVRVECEAGRCSCTVNGESVDCDELPGVPHAG